MRTELMNAPVHIWSGLLSGGNYGWQEGLRVVGQGIGDAAFHASQSGYEGWTDVVEATRRRKAESIVLIGHSNGGYAITKCAEALKADGIRCYLVCFDRTMKPCPKLGANVPEAIDIWAGLRNLEKGPDFAGHLALVDMQPESHISVISNSLAQRIAIDFGRKWKRA